MRLEREQFPEAGRYERSARRRGYANGYKSKKLDTPASTLTLNVSKTAGLVDGCLIAESHSNLKNKVAFS